MSASITLANLSWSTPDGRPLLSELDLSFGAERTGLVGRNGVGKTHAAQADRRRSARRSPARCRSAARWACCARRCRPIRDETVADLFGVAEALALLRRAEAGEADADELAHADWTLEARMAAALGQART